MTTCKRAIKLLRAAGREFNENFLSTYSGAVPLRSKEPGICWAVNGTVSFGVTAEFAGPNSVGDAASPILFRLRTNMNPPPAIFYHLRSPTLRHKLCLSSTPTLAKEPVLELTATPDEIGKFGRWLAAWLDAKLYAQPMSPQPPLPLISIGWHDDGSTRQDDFCSLGREWPKHLYLWTPTAFDAWMQWLAK